MKKTIAVFMQHGSHWNPERTAREQAYRDEHARFMDSLFDANAVVLGGPFADGSGSLVILAAESVETARAAFQQDPWTLHDVLAAAEFKEWTTYLDGRDKG